MSLTSTTSLTQSVVSDPSYTCGIRRGNVRIVNGKAEKIPRPMNAFMLFSNEFRKQVKEEFRDEPNNVISTRLGAMWKAMSENERMKYHDLAKEAEKEHKRKYPNYQYCPGEARKFKKARLEEKARQEALYRSILQNSGFSTVKSNVHPLQFSLPTNTSMHKPTAIPTCSQPIPNVSVPASSQPLSIVPQNVQLMKPAILSVPTTANVPKQSNIRATPESEMKETTALTVDSGPIVTKNERQVKEEKPKLSNNSADRPQYPTGLSHGQSQFLRIDSSLLPRPAHQPVERMYSTGIFKNNSSMDGLMSPDYPQIVYVPCDVKYAEKFGWTKDMFYAPMTEERNESTKNENNVSQSSSHTSLDSSASSVDYGSYYSPMDGGCWGEEDILPQPGIVNAIRRKSFVGSPPKENGLTPTYAILSESLSGTTINTSDSSSSASLGEVTPRKLQQLVDGASFVQSTKVLSTAVV